MKRLVRLVAVVALAIGTQVGASPGAHASAVTSTTTDCQLGNGISHVVNVVFDNVHLTRDNPNVPSDLEQMPNLLNFIEQNGTMISHNYTPLISHTANDIVTTLTGLYADQQGLAVANSYFFYEPNGAVRFPQDQPSAFQYWTDRIGNGTFNNLTSTGSNTPAPWVPFTRAGCNVGGVSTANIELENNGNITQVFGANSAEAAELASNPGQATADFIGIAIHCAQGSAVCGASPNAKPDLLPSEPGGYNGFQGLFGHKYVAPAISPSGPLTDLDGNTITGFPGFGGISASQSLGYTAAMLEHGVPVTYSYISDAHDNHSGFGTFGPGEAGYVARLKAYDTSFGTFFARLAADGITPQNTLFNFSSDENDHYTGKILSGCDGVTVPCVYDHSLGTGNIGEITTNLSHLMSKAGVSTPFQIHFDSAPAVYLNPRVDRTSATARTFEQTAATLIDPNNYITGQSTTLMQRMADSVEMKNLHMITGDPARVPTFIYFANPDYFFQSFGLDFQQNAGFAWQHGDFQPDIVTSWLGLVGPGVQNLGLDDTTWAGHADTRPTILALTGLQDDYASEGRVLLEDLLPSAVPTGLRLHRGVVMQLAQVYSQLNAPVGEFGMDTLKISTAALASSSAGDATYNNLESEIAGFGAQRDPLAAQIVSVLAGVEFGGKTLDVHQAQDLIAQGQSLLATVHAAAA